MANAKKCCQETVNAERRSWILVSELPLGTQGPIVLFSKNRDECHGQKRPQPTSLRWKDGLANHPRPLDSFVHLGWI